MLNSVPVLLCRDNAIDTILFTFFAYNELILPTLHLHYFLENIFIYIHTHTHTYIYIIKDIYMQAKIAAG